MQKLLITLHILVEKPFESLVDQEYLDSERHQGSLLSYIRELDEEEGLLGCVEEPWQIVSAILVDE